MSMDKAGIGFCDKKDSFEAGKRAASDALKAMGSEGGSLSLAFCTGKHNYQACFQGIKSVVGDTPVIGGAAIGIITNKYLGYEGYQVGVAVLPDDLKFDIAVAGELDKGEKQTGLVLGRELALKRNPSEQLALIFYDSIRAEPPPAPVLNISSYLLEGFEYGLGNKPPVIVGAGLIGTCSFAKGKQFCGDTVVEQHAAATLLSGNYTVYTEIMHGCKPMSDYHTITRVEGPVIYEIDGIPAMDVIDNLLRTTEWQKRLPLLLVTLGVNHGDKYGPYDENNYVNRLIIGIIPEQKAVVLFEADFENGAEFQFMRRNAKLMEKSAEQGSRKAVEWFKSKRQEPFFALYIDCAGRTAGYSGAEIEEASVVQRVLGQDIPLLGFYSGVEIAPLMGKSRGLDWTGVLLMLARSK